MIYRQGFASLSLFPSASTLRTLGFHWNNLTDSNAGFDPGITHDLIARKNCLSVNRKPDFALRVRHANP
jgi:hypothetical protein